MTGAKVGLTALMVESNGSLIRYDWMSTESEQMLERQCYIF
jgi:hypothetical protein